MVAACRDERQRLRNGLIGLNGLMAAADADCLRLISGCSEFVVRRVPSATLGKNGDDG